MWCKDAGTYWFRIPIHLSLSNTYLPSPMALRNQTRLIDVSVKTVYNPLPKIIYFFCSVVNVYSLLITDKHGASRQKPKRYSDKSMSRHAKSHDITNNISTRHAAYSDIPTTWNCGFAGLCTVFFSFEFSLFTHYIYANGSNLFPLKNAKIRMQTKRLMNYSLEL